jgi:conserved oligomeric Golgi complex subunit 4
MTIRRFIQHTVREVNRARALRHQAEQEERRVERERREWATGMSGDEAKGENEDDDDDEDEEKEYSPFEILPAHTQLQEAVAEVGGYYSAIESCLLLASMQRALAVPPDDPRQYSPLTIVQASSTKTGPSSRNGIGSGALQTSLVESSLYAARRGLQRAFATGHTGTASAVSILPSDSSCRFSTCCGIECLLTQPCATSPPICPGGQSVR